MPQTSASFPIWPYGNIKTETFGGKKKRKKGSTESQASGDELRRGHAGRRTVVETNGKKKSRGKDVGANVCRGAAVGFRKIRKNRPGQEGGTTNLHSKRR